MIKFLPFLAILGLAFGLPSSLLEERIVGGSVTTIEQFPYQVSLQYYDQHICGGSIVSPKVILTAAHCTAGQSASALSIRAGSSFHASGGQKIKVSQIAQYSGYNPGNQDSDISLLILAQSISLSSSAKQVKLATAEASAGTIATVTGWGRLYDGGPIPSQLYQVQVPLITRNDCKSRYSGYTITENMICAGIDAGGIDSCQGDSGGPLVANGVQIGVVSWGVGCAEPRKPGVYTNVPKFVSWINQH